MAGIAQSEQKTFSLWSEGSWEKMRKTRKNNMRVDKSKENTLVNIYMHIYTHPRLHKLI